MATCAGLVHLKTIRVKELGVVGGMGVVEAEGCDWVPGVIAVWEHAEICQGCEQSSYICHCPANRPSNVTVQHQRNDTSSAAHVPSVTGGGPWARGGEGRWLGGRGGGC